MDGSGVPVVKKETVGRPGKTDGQPAHTRQAGIHAPAMGSVLDSRSPAFSEDKLRGNDGLPDSRSRREKCLLKEQEFTVVQCSGLTRPFVRVSKSPRLATVIVFTPLFSACSGSLGQHRYFSLFFYRLTPKWESGERDFHRSLFDNPFVFSKSRVWQKRNPLFLQILLFIRSGSDSASSVAAPWQGGTSGPALPATAGFCAQSDGQSNSSGASASAGLRSAPGILPAWWA